ncbi:hypothetical protein GGR77_000133 [Xanthomonas translucens]
MDVRIFLAFWAASAVPVHAQQVYKCISGKQVSYQSAPCATGQAAKAWDATPQPIDPYQERRLQAISDELRASNAPAPVYRTTGASVGLARDANACESARAGREAAYKAVGVRRSFELSSYWDNRVQQACK